MKAVSLTVNGTPRTATVPPRTSLADFLRNACHLTGTHLGCEHGVCGACTILLDGVPARSCIAFAVALEGRDVRTVEGFESEPLMTRLRTAFHEAHALQCGFCTSGMLITARDIVQRIAAADERRIRTELAGNLCRCTGYQGIVDAIQRVMQEVPADDRISAPRVPGRTSGRPAFQPFTPVADAASPGASAAAPATVAIEDGWSRITDHFEIARPPAEVWQAFADPARVAQCLPGAELSDAGNGQLVGRIRIGFGPIKADFATSLHHHRDDAAKRGTIEGEGGDEKRATRAKGRASYRLVDGETAGTTRVELGLDYRLTGPLAQFGRTALVRDLSRHLIAAFARNLGATMQGDELPKAASPAGAALRAILWARIRRLFGLSAR